MTFWRRINPISYSNLIINIKELLSELRKEEKNLAERKEIVIQTIRSLVEVAEKLFIQNRIYKMKKVINE